MDPRHLPFRDFHRMFHGPVSRFAASLGVPMADVGDVVQEIFVVAHQRRRELDHPEAMTSWLFEVTRRQVSNFRRKKWNTAIDLPGDDESEPTMITTPRRVESGRHRLMLLAGRLADLGERERQAWLARYLDHGTLPQVAERCGCSLAEVKRRLARAEAAIEGLQEETIP